MDPPQFCLDPLKENVLTAKIAKNVGPQKRNSLKKNIWNPLLNCKKKLFDPPNNLFLAPLQKTFFSTKKKEKHILPLILFLGPPPNKM